jgi:hypothetical protein
MRNEGRLAKNWWEGVRRNVLKFAGADTKVKDVIKAVNLADPNYLETAIDMAMPKKIVITYISRQDVRRRLIHSDHDGLVKALQELVERKNAEWIMDGRGKGSSREWELNVVKAEQMSRDDQVKNFGRTSVGLVSIMPLALIDSYYVIRFFWEYMGMA